MSLQTQAPGDGGARHREHVIRSHKTVPPRSRPRLGRDRGTTSQGKVGASYSTAGGEPRDDGTGISMGSIVSRFGVVDM